MERRPDLEQKKGWVVGWSYEFVSMGLSCLEYGPKQTCINRNKTSAENLKLSMLSVIWNNVDYS